MSAPFRQTVCNSALLLRRTLNPSYPRPIQLTQRTLQTAPTLLTNHNTNNGTDSRESLNPSRAEGTGSGTDDEVASHDASFDPHNTEPESEVEATGRESAERNKKSNPLDVSPGNKNVNKTRDPSQDPPDSGVEKPPSARGWTRKHKSVNEGN